MKCLFSLTWKTLRHYYQSGKFQLTGSSATFVFLMCKDKALKEWALAVTNDQPWQMGLRRIFAFYFCHFWLAQILFTIRVFLRSGKGLSLTPFSSVVFPFNYNDSDFKPWTMVLGWVCLLLWLAKHSTRLALNVRSSCLCLSNTHHHNPVSVKSYSTLYGGSLLF